MECRPLDITLNSAKDLKDLNLFSKMDLYAVVSIHGDYYNNNNASQQRTHIDKDCGPNPKWNFPMKFTVDVSAAEQNRLALVVKIKAEKKLAGDKEVGEVHVPIKELLESYGEESKDERRASYSVRTPSGKAKGVLDFTYKFGEKFTATQQKAKNVDTDTPVTAYPIGYGAAGPSGGPAPAYPPPGMLAAGTVAAAYPYAHQPPPHGGYPPQGGYPPPPMYGGYPPQPAYNGGYPQYPHQPAPYPQAGYGGYGAKPPKKSGGSGGKMALGLGAGLLGGLLVGDMISDVSEMGAYDSGYDAGFDDAGGDF